MNTTFLFFTSHLFTPFFTFFFLTHSLSLAQTHNSIFCSFRSAPFSYSSPSLKYLRCFADESCGLFWSPRICSAVDRIVVSEIFLNCYLARNINFPYFFIYSHNLFLLVPLHPPPPPPHTYTRMIQSLFFLLFPVLLLSGMWTFFLEPAHFLDV